MYFHIFSNLCYIACRDEIKALEAIKSIKAKVGTDCQLEFMQLDLSSFASVEIFAEDFLSEEGQLDLLINNAGVCAPPDFTTTEDAIEQQYQVNYLSHFLLTRLLIPRLASTPDSRIINLTSCLYFAGKL